MNAREYLESFKIAESRIKLKMRQVEQLRENLASLGVCMDKDQVSHTRNVSAMADSIASILDIEKEIDQQTAAILDRKKWAYRLLDMIHPEKASLLSDHYMHGKTVLALSQELYITERHVNRRLSDALAEFQIVLDKFGIPKSGPEMSG